MLGSLQAALCSIILCSHLANATLPGVFQLYELPSGECLWRDYMMLLYWLLPLASPGSTGLMLWLHSLWMQCSYWDPSTLWGVYLGFRVTLLVLVFQCFQRFPLAIRDRWNGMRGKCVTTVLWIQDDWHGFSVIQNPSIFARKFSWNRGSNAFRLISHLRVTVTVGITIWTTHVRREHSVLSGPPLTVICNLYLDTLVLLLYPTLWPQTDKFNTFSMRFDKTISC